MTPIDLAREKRLRAIDEKMDRLLREHPEIADRTAALLAGELTEGKLSAADLSDSLTLRVPRDLADRAARLAPYVATLPNMAAFGKPKRAAVVRLALIEGLNALEQRFGLTTAAPSKIEE